MRKEFVADVSHELKTPITTISGFSELILNGVGTCDQKTKDYIYRIYNDVNNKSYIGLTTKTVETRWKKHLANSSFVQYHLYDAMRLYGVEHFFIETLEKVDDTKLAERE